MARWLFSVMHFSEFGQYTFVRENTGDLEHEVDKADTRTGYAWVSIPSLVSEERTMAPRFI